MCPDDKHAYSLVDRELNASKTKVSCVVLFCTKCGEILRKYTYDVNQERSKPFNTRENL